MENARNALIETDQDCIEEVGHLAKRNPARGCATFRIHHVAEFDAKARKQGHGGADCFGFLGPIIMENERAHMRVRNGRCHIFDHKIGVVLECYGRMGEYFFKRNYGDPAIAEEEAPLVLAV